MNLFLDTVDSIANIVEEKEKTAIIITCDNVMSYYANEKENIENKIKRYLIETVQQIISNNKTGIISGLDIYPMVKEKVLSIIKDYYKRKLKQRKADYIYINNLLLEIDNFIEYIYSEIIGQSIERSIKLMIIDALRHNSPTIMFNSDFAKYLSTIEYSIGKEIENNKDIIRGHITEYIYEKFKEYITKYAYEKFNTTLFINTDGFNSMFNQDIRLDDIKLILTPDAFLEILNSKIEPYCDNLKRDFLVLEMVM
ncbi:MAG: hypothetical protein QXV17_08710 [Candidatus Micrarchaeaceae archaeon]